MQQSSMSETEAQQLAATLRQQGYFDSDIVSRLVQEGFTQLVAQRIVNNIAKSKKDFFSTYNKAKPHYGETVYWERGGCLTAWLSLQGIGAILVAIFGAITLLGMLSGEVDFVSPDFVFVMGVLLIVLGIVQFICVRWLWNGKRKGFHGLLALFVVGAVISVMSGGFGTVGGSVVGVSILYFLVNPKIDQLT